jgi:hypothetical protein
MRVKIALCALYLSTSACAVAPDLNRGASNEEKYAVAYCLAVAYPESEASYDAQYVSGAYIQRGEYDIDVYERIRDFVDEYRKKPYVSKHNKNLSIMQCLDLYNSENLARAIKEAAANTESGDR